MSAAARRGLSGPQAEIAEAWEEMLPIAPLTPRMPRWLASRLRVGREPTWELWEKIHRHDWFDHPGWSRCRCRESCGAERHLVSEPYGLTLNDLWSLLGFCSRYGLGCDVTALSPHNPGGTVRVELWPAEEPR